MFIEILDELLERDGITKNALAAALGCKGSFVANWYTRSKENKDYLPHGESIKKLAKYFHVSPGYLCGLTDEYGLNNQDWYVISSLISSWLAAIHRDYEWLFAEAEIEGVDIESFENGLSPLKAEQLEKIGEICRIPDIKLYLPAVYALKLWPEMQKTAPEIGDGLNDIQLSAVSELKGLTPEETVRAIAYIQGLRDNRAKQ